MGGSGSCPTVARSPTPSAYDLPLPLCLAHTRAGAPRTLPDPPTGDSSHTDNWLRRRPLPNRWLQYGRGEDAAGGRAGDGPGSSSSRVRRAWKQRQVVCAGCQRLSDRRIHPQPVRRLPPMKRRRRRQSMTAACTRSESRWQRSRLRVSSSKPAVSSTNVRSRSGSTQNIAEPAPSPPNVHGDEVWPK